MSDIMKSIPFGQLMEWILPEHKATGQVFGIQKWQIWKRQQRFLDENWRIR